PDVFTWRVTHWRVSVISQSHGCRTLAGGVLLDPRVPVVPPAALIVDRVGEPCLRIGTADVTRAMAGSRATRRSGDRDGVSAVCEYKCHVAADHRDCPITVLPRGDVVGRRGKDVGIDGYLSGVDRHPADTDSARPRESIVQRCLHHLCAEACGQICLVSRPVEQSYGGWRLAQQVV